MHYNFIGIPGATTTFAGRPQSRVREGQNECRVLSTNLHTERGRYFETVKHMKLFCTGAYTEQ